MKKTTLDDDAQIYHHSDNLTDKEKLAHMDHRQRRQYFIDYYLVKVIIVAGIVCVAVFLIWYFARGKEETVLYVAVADHTLDREKTDEMTGAMEEALGADGDLKDVVIDDSFYSNSSAASKLQVYLFAGQLDVIIARRDQWAAMAADGWLVPVSEIEGATDGIDAALILDAAGSAKTEESAGGGEVLPYGIDLSACALLTTGDDALSEPVLAFAQNSKHQENAVVFLRYLLDL